MSESSDELVDVDELLDDETTKTSIAERLLVALLHSGEFILSEATRDRTHQSSLLLLLLLLL